LVIQRGRHRGRGWAAAVLLLPSAWAIAALRFDGGGWVIPLAFLAFVLILLFRVRHGGLAIELWLAGFAAVLGWLARHDS